MHLYLSFLFNTVCLSTCAFAYFVGGRPERIGAGINAAAVVSTWALRHWNVAHFAPADGLSLLIDVWVASGFYNLAITTTRFWPIWAAGFALADLFMSALGGLLPRVPLFAYHTGLGIYAYLALGALALGTFRLPRDAEPYLRNGSRTSWIRHLKETS